MFATMMVLAFPPRESCSRRVSFESLYGMWLLLFSTNAEITMPRVESERLILFASFNRSPSAPVLLCRSLPARSTKLSFPTLYFFFASSSESFKLHSMVMMKMACERELCSFMFVEPTDRFLFPTSMIC